LGLDLQGGLYIILGIDFPKVYRDEVRTYANKIIYTLKENSVEASIGDLNVTTATDPSQKVVIKDTLKLEDAKRIIKEYYGYPLRLVKEEGNTLEYALQTTLKTEIEKSSVDKSIEVIRNRIDEFGVTEPEIISQGKDRVVVQLPGIKNIEKAKELIGRTAKLEFRFVNDTQPQAQLDQWVEKAKAAGIVYKKGESFNKFNEQVNEFLKAELPGQHEIRFERKVNKRTLEMEYMIPYLVEINAPLTGADLQDAGVRIDQQEQKPYISVSFKSNAVKRFADVTEKNVGRRMAIILDQNIYSAPQIRDKISGGEAQITLGRGSYDSMLSEARDLSLVLRAGSLPVELEFQEQRVVGPSLGADSVADAKFGTILGCGFLFLLLFFYYRVSGVIATLTLVLNVLFTLGCLIAIQATLTLPGIAGIALTVGMAVDANILIYERIKEELRAGGSPLASMQAGFARAFWTILDANITTMIAGLALLNFGTGPIRGFAVTLIIGIIVTVYTAYFVSEIAFEWYLWKNKGKSISI
jgi:protein-export membrane protein SecD